METIDIKEIKKQLSKKLETKRYEHSIGVADTAACLAMNYHYDVEKAYLAGILHDCAKCLSNEESIELCDKYKIKLSSIEIDNPFLIHAKLGSVIAKKVYCVNDDEILSSIRWHTTGTTNMSLLEKIIFSADFIEPGRKKLECLPVIRETIFDNLDLAVYMILKQTVIHLEEKQQIIDDNSIQALMFYEKIVNSNIH